ncbi:hypothetical protein G3N95_11665 [Paraburkholderia sp. Tr-20389]|uniref:hypothetical protein n=1 Tax=Paraburkholderia sp. Tr-20389 TaxID=2703903 RepID=UPI00197FFDDA|nr:hypothetical protein [Paraburkholderia sp. Tr-20389]MBN3753599.1 hypothetical protein [Paraburkholderia sp. Tr-20389]
MFSAREVEEDAFFKWAPLVKTPYEPAVPQTGFGTLLSDVRETDSTRGGIHHEFLTVDGERTVHLDMKEFAIRLKLPLQNRAARKRVADADMLIQVVRRRRNAVFLEYAGEPTTAKRKLERMRTATISCDSRSPRRIPASNPSSTISAESGQPPGLPS